MIHFLYQMYPIFVRFFIFVILIEGFSVSSIIKSIFFYKHLSKISYNLIKYRNKQPHFQHIEIYKQRQENFGFNRQRLVHTPFISDILHVFT